jgi:hypothetical protein
MLTLLKDSPANVDSRSLGKSFKFVKRIFRHKVAWQYQSSQDSFFTGEALGSVVRAH